MPQGLFALSLSLSLIYVIYWNFTVTTSNRAGATHHMEQELFTLPEHLSSPPVFEEICVALLNFPVFVYIDYCSSWLYLLSLFSAHVLSIYIYLRLFLNHVIVSSVFLSFCLFVFVFALLLFLYIYFFICQRTNSIPSILSVMLDK